MITYEEYLSDIKYDERQDYQAGKLPARYLPPAILYTVHFEAITSAGPLFIVWETHTGHGVTFYG